MLFQTHLPSFTTLLTALENPTSGWTPLASVLASERYHQDVRWKPRMSAVLNPFPWGCGMTWLIWAQATACSPAATILLGSGTSPLNEGWQPHPIWLAPAAPPSPVFPSPCPSHSHQQALQPLFFRVYYPYLLLGLSLI